MKNIIGILSLVFVFTLTSNAQQNNQRYEKKVDFSPKQYATLQTKRMDLNLDLNKSQEKAVFELLESNAIEREKVRNEFRSNREKGKKPTSQERFEHQNSRLEKQIAHKAAMKKILSEEQFVKWEETARNRMKAHKKRIARGKNNSKKGSSKGLGNNEPQNRQFYNRS
jgi:hypothetical protein